MFGVVVVVVVRIKAAGFEKFGRRIFIARVGCMLW